MGAVAATLGGIGKGLISPILGGLGGLLGGLGGGGAPAAAPAAPVPAAATSQGPWGATGADMMSNLPHMNPMMSFMSSMSAPPGGPQNMMQALQPFGQMASQMAMRFANSDFGQAALQGAGGVAKNFMNNIAAGNSLGASFAGSGATKYLKAFGQGAMNSLANKAGVNPAALVSANPILRTMAGKLSKSGAHGARVVDFIKDVTGSTGQSNLQAMANVMTPESSRRSSGMDVVPESGPATPAAPMASTSEAAVPPGGVSWALGNTGLSGRMMGGLASSAAGPSAYGAQGVTARGGF